MMEIAALILGVIVLGALGMIWDYYKPSRFRTGYHNVRKNNDHIIGGPDGNNDSSCGNGGD